MLASVVISGCGSTVTPAIPGVDAASVDAPSDARRITIERSAGSGGKVTSSVGGIDCGATCTASVADGTSMVLTATPDDRSVFTGWSGPCTGTDVTCSFTVNGDVTVGAGFSVKRFTVTVVLDGGGPNIDVGTVSGAPGGLNCSVRSAACSASLDAGAQMTLTAVATASWRFVRWSVASCSGTAPCVLTANADQVVTATFAPVTCGNGIKEAAEECDDGNANDHDDCTNACKLAKCGDGVQKMTGANIEECDDGNSNNQDNCTNTCKVAKCGDGIQKTTGTNPEECDDANTNDHDNCTNACKLARCGDGILKTSGTNIEECDDANTNDHDNCTNACRPAECGDGILETTGTNIEECDDANTNNQDDCTNTCRIARCGDGIQKTSGINPEECDDANTNDHDNCTNACKLARCGDGILKTTGTNPEECDDGPNGDNFCTSSCHCGGPGEPCCQTSPKCDTGLGCAVANNRCSACPISDFRLEVCQSGFPGTRNCSDTILSASDIFGPIGIAISGFNGEVTHNVSQSGTRQINYSATVHEGDLGNPGKNTTAYSITWCRL